MRIAVLFLLLTVFAWSEDKPDAVELRRQVMDWVPVDATAFAKLLEQAKAAGVEDGDTLLARLDASLLFGDVEKLKELVPAVEKEEADIIKRKGGNAAAREEVARSLKLAKQFQAFAEKRPTEVARRAEMFRNYYYAQITLEHARLLDAAVDQFCIEKNVKDGAAVTWEQLRTYLKTNTQIHATGATIFGDRFGPFASGVSTVVPRATYEKLKAYLPADAWGDHAPK